MEKDKYEKPQFEIINLLNEVFTEDSVDPDERADDDIFGENENLLTSLLNMAKELNIVKDIFGFDEKEDGSLVDKDGNVYNYDENGNIVDAEGKIVVTAEELSAQEQEGESTEDPSIEGEGFEGETPEGETTEGETTPEQTPPTETDLGELETLGDEIDDVFSGGGSGETTVPDDTPIGSEETIPDVPVAEEPIVESQVVEEPIIETPTDSGSGDGFVE